MTPEQFERRLRFITECAEEGKLLADAQLSAELAMAYRDAWENRVPEVAKTIKCYSSDLPKGELVIFRSLSGRWVIVQEEPDEDIKAATPALALEAWRKENKG